MHACVHRLVQWHRRGDGKRARVNPSHCSVCLLARGELELFKLGVSADPSPGATEPSKALARELRIGTVLARVMQASGDTAVRAVRAGDNTPQPSTPTL
jgi:hypothetical protein